MKISFQVLISLTLSLSTALPAGAGTMTSSGILPMVTMPRFFGATPVKYCVLNSADFSLPLEQARAEIRAALSDWVNQIEAIGPTRLVRLNQAGQEQALSLDFQEMSCSSETQLKFELGRRDSEIEKPMKTSGYFTFVATKRPSALSAPVILWVAPDRGADNQKYFSQFVDPVQMPPSLWCDQLRFRNTIAHELGHLFGFDHEPGDVMSPDELIKQVQPAPVKQEPFPAN